MSRLCLGLDIGGTKIAVGVVQLEGSSVQGGGGGYRILARRRVATAEFGDGPMLLERLAALGEAACVEARVEPAALAGIGVALPGPVDPRTHRLVAASTLPGLIGQPIIEYFAERWNRGAAGWVQADNDANAAALGEALYGAGRGGRVVCYFTVSTGIGGGVVVDGRLFTGAAGLAGEFGHLKLRAQGPLCLCGDRGCLEALASGPAIARRAREALAEDSGLLRPLFDEDPGLVTAERVADAARQGDSLAQRVWDEAMTDLGAGLATVTNLFNPDIVVIGGGVARSADLLLPRLRQIVAERAMPMIARAARIECAGLGDDVGIVGAAVLAGAKRADRADLNRDIIV
jgi:glucokinase